VELAHGVKLVEVQPIGSQALQRAVQLRGGRIASPLAGLAPQKDAVAYARHPRLEANLGLAVPGRHVDVIHAAIEDELNSQVCRLLVNLTDARRPERDDTAEMAGPPQSSLLHRNPPRV